MLEKAVTAVKQDKAKALDAFNAGEAGFKDRDLYVVRQRVRRHHLTAHPYGQKGKQLRDIKGYHGAPFGETIMQDATDGAIKQTTYWWPRPGTDQPLEKTAFYTKVSDQICGVASTRNNLLICPILALSGHSSRLSSRQPLTQSGHWQCLIANLWRKLP